MEWRAFADGSAWPLGDNASHGSLAMHAGGFGRRLRPEPLPQWGATLAQLEERVVKHDTLAEYGGRHGPEQLSHMRRDGAEGMEQAEVRVPNLFNGACGPKGGVGQGSDMGQ